MTFKPDWASPPGDSLAESIEAMGMTVEEFACRAGVGLQNLREIMRDKDPAPITVDVAVRIGALVGTPDFWLRRERLYREHLPFAEATAERRRWTIFISGHLDLTPAEFRLHYADAIVQAAPAWFFVVGDARGTDKMAQDLIKLVNGRATVYHMFSAPRHNAGFVTVGGFESDEERDEAMTFESSRDIAWVRPGRERSGTARNLARRAAPT